MYCFEAVSRTLNDLCQVNDQYIFGNIPVILGGDFAQTLPVVQHGYRAALLNSCLQRSSIWPHLQQLCFTQNMRVSSNPVNVEFIPFLATMSYNPNQYSTPKVPGFIHQLHSLSAFCQHIFPQKLMVQAVEDHTILKSRPILSFRNDTVSEFNELLILNFPGELFTFHAINTSPGVDQLPAEYLQSIHHASLPPSKLCLKIEVPVILLQNLSLKDGLLNGTRLTVTHIGHSHIRVRIMEGKFSGQERMLPRIKVTTLENDLLFILTRKQFPIRLCFAMTVNKAQEQSLSVVGVNLWTLAFSHE
ncbi:unnamed protein product [Tuber aestivum]|uniref:ATP-dependent DNA helicase n=1 Tax=Tuber aestivum TaxID=59557 RepID=A0A292Q3M4_9PEZI|nr:unnamed protein product [Tuber aestivum]